MASLSSGPGTESKRSPQMLKNFLIDDLSSSSSTGFRSFPRRACCATVRNLVEMDIKAGDSGHARKLLRSRSKAASKTISAFQKASEVVINVVRHLPFSSIKASSQPQSKTKQGILPRSLSRRLRRRFWKKRDNVENHDIKEIKVRVMIKDIIRWKSFRDLIEEKQQPLSFSSSSLHISSITAAAATTTSSITNSWSECDFTSEYLQSSGRSSEYLGENEGEEGKECSAEEKMTSNSNRGRIAVGEDSMETTTYAVDPKGECPYEEKEQFSPISVLDFPDEEEDVDGDTEAAALSPFHQSLANMERKKQKLTQKIRRFENLSQLEPVDLEKRIALSEKDDSGESPFDDSRLLSQEDEVEQNRAMELLKLMKATSTFEGLKTGILDRVLLDFLMEKIMARRDDQIKTTGTTKVAEGKGSDFKDVVKVARDWMSGNHCGELALDLEYNREAYVREMESEGGRWRKFEVEQGELVVEVENEVMRSLVDELFIDLLS